MPLRFPRRISLPLAIGVIFVAGVIAGAWRYELTREELLSELMISARQFAMAFDPAELSEVNGDSSDSATPASASIKHRLNRLRHLTAGARSVFLFRTTPTGESTLLAYAGPKVPARFSVPHERVTAAVKNRGLGTDDLRETSTEGPIVDSAGRWVTAYAQVIGPRSGPAIELLGLEMSAEAWPRKLWLSAFGTAGYVWVLLVLPLAILISTRRQTRQRDTLRNLTEAMEQGQSAVMIVSLNQRINYANAGFCRQLGYTREELVGRGWREFQGFQAPPQLIRELVRTVGAGQPWSGEWTMRRKDGGFFPVRGGVTPVKDRTGRIRSFVAVFDDITALHQSENMLREAKDRAEAGDRAKGQFLATMSHEVRTPLNGIVGFASLLLDTELTPEQQEFVTTIRTSSETLIQLTGDILDYARIESGRLKLEPQPCDPRECVENALDLVARVAAEKKIELLHWVDDSVPLAIIADVGRLRQVLVNLVNNAVKFTAAGVVDVQVRARTLPTEGETLLEFSVRDTGIGIAPQHHAKIFRPFTQADETTTRRFGGTGLGLAICKNLVELMNGSISFVSQPGVGSTFSFTIRVPVAPPDGIPPPRGTLEGQRLAVVAANPDFREELARLARRLGATTFAAEISTLRQQTDWDIAIVDITDSIAVELGAQPIPSASLPPEKIVGLVSIALPLEVRAALRSHVRVLLNKPPHQDTLRSLLVAHASSAPFPPRTTEMPTHKFDLDVLIVEDNVVNQQLIQRIVTNLGCRWNSAGNGREALDQLGRFVPDIVLMDLHMPEMDGLTALKRIRAGSVGSTAQKVWIIALTADARAEQRERTLRAGANDYLTKPVRLPELIAAFERYTTSTRRL